MSEENRSWGNALKQAREAKAITLDAVVKELNISRSYIEGLEEEDFTKLPRARVYINGFYTSYKRFLGLEAPEVDQWFSRSLKDTTQEPALMGVGCHKHKNRVPGKALIWGSVIIALIMVLGSQLIKRVEPDLHDEEISEEITPVVDQKPSPVTPPVQKPVAAVNIPESIILRLTEKAWLEVSDSSGNRLVSGIFNPGYTQTFATAVSPVLTTGNAGGIQIEYSGQQKTLGGSGEVRRSVDLQQEILNMAKVSSK